MHFHWIKKLAAILLASLTVIAFGAETVPQADIRGDDVTYIDPIFSVRTVQAFGDLLLEYCSTNFLENRTNLLAQWEAWPYSKVRIETFVNGRLWDNDKSILAYAKSRFPISSMSKEKGLDICKNFPAFLNMLSSRIPKDQASMFLPQLSTPADPQQAAGR